jgi:hypothetical protein
MQRIGMTIRSFGDRAGSRWLICALLGGLPLALAGCGFTSNTSGEAPAERVEQAASALGRSCTPAAKVEQVRIGGDTFLHRTGHAVARLKDDVYVARGVDDDIDTQSNTFRDDLFRLDPRPGDRGTFDRLSEQGAAIPGPMAYPCMVGDDEGSGTLLLFGGAHYVFELDPNFVSSFEPFDTLWQYRPSGGRWTALAPQGPRPGARNGCNAEFFGHAMYVFGGLGPSLQTNNELWRYDTRAETWTLLPAPGPVPPPRFIGASTLDREEGKIYVYNGLHATAEGFSPIGDFWVYEIATNAWRQLANTPTPPRAKGALSVLRGPCGKKYLVYTGGNIDTTVRCAGFDEDTTATNEIWAFDTEAETWQKLDTVGSAPRLEFVQGVTVRDRQILVGGWFDVPDPAKICRQVWNESVYQVTLVER